MSLNSLSQSRNRVLIWLLCRYKIVDDIFHNLILWIFGDGVKSVLETEKGMERVLKINFEIGKNRGRERGIESQRSMKRGMERGIERSMKRGIERGIERSKDRGIKKV